MTYEITAPTRHTGTIVGVHFSDGRAVLDAVAPAALAYFQRHPAYTVRTLPSGREGDGVQAPPERPAGNASKGAWRSYALTLGVDPELVDAAESRGDLIELVDAYDRQESTP